MENKENKGNGLVICTLLLLLLVIGLGGYVAYDKLLSKKETSTSSTTKKGTEEEKEIEKEYDLSEAKKLLEKFGFYENVSCGENIYSRIYNDTYKAIVALNNIDSSETEEEECSNIYNEEDFKTEKNGYSKNIGVCRKGEKTKTIKYEVANKKYKEMFGEDLPKKSINGIEVGNLFYKFYDYIESKDSFVSVECGDCGGTCVKWFNVNEIKQAVEKDNKLYIDVYYYFKSFIGDYQRLKTILIDERIDVNTNEEFIKIVKDKYLKYLDVYQIVFEKENNHYVFKSLSQKLS